MLKAVEDYTKGCNGLATAVNNKYWSGEREPRWIDEEVGGLCDFGFGDILACEDMARLVQECVPHKEYSAWRQANFDNEKYINLKSWLMGVRHDQLR